jgi:hypothetical protein
MELEMIDIEELKRMAELLMDEGMPPESSGAWRVESAVRRRSNALAKQAHG